MLIAGISLSGYGIVGLISLFIQIQKVSNNPYLRLDEDSLIKLFTIDTIALAAGILLIIFAIMKNKNKNAMDKLVNNQKNTLEKAKCPNCGLNLSNKSDKCPQCGTYITKNY